MKKFQFIIWIFCLGVFLIPKQNVYAMTLPTNNCCSANSTEESDCCQPAHNSHSKNKDSQESCTDNCCHNCATCHNIPTIAIIKLTTEYSVSCTEYQSRESNFDYSDPHFSNHLDEIWQPPKI